MKIKINNKDFTIFDYDDTTTILERYCLTQDDSLPFFFKIEDKELSISNNTSIRVRDIREDIKNLSAEDLENKSIIEKLLISYPGIKKSDIGILWVKKTYDLNKKLSKPIDIQELRQLDKYIFSTSSKVESFAKEFTNDIISKRTKLKTKIIETDKIFSLLDKQETVQIQEFNTEEITNNVVLSLPNKENLLDIFDAMEVSKDIPFIYLVYKKRRYFKVYPHITPPDSWIDFQAPSQGLYFKVLNFPSGKLSGRQIMLENLYSDAVWHPEDRIELNFKVKNGISEEDINKKIFSSLGDRVEYKIITKKQTSIKGTFTVPKFDFNRAIFADMVYTNPIIKYFLYFNEKQKTVFSKPRFYVYYSPNQQGNIPSSLTLTITPQTDGEERSVIIRISHASNLQQANTARIVFSKLLSIYNNLYDETVKIYTDLIPNFKTVASIFQKKTKKKEDKKTGPRAVALRKFQPEMFGSRYPDQCQREKQPYIIKSKEEAEALAETLGDPHKVMYFEGAWYACEPREPDDKNFKHIYPGLKTNTSKTDKKYKDSFSLIPCCYALDQFEKSASNLRKYYKDIQQEGKYNVKKDKEGGMGYIVGQNKKLEAGRYGEVPFNWEKLLSHMKVEKITKGRQEIYPFLRHGVLQGPDSFIHCLEKAFNPKYTSAVAEEKRKMVMDLRKKISTSHILSLGKQELCDYSLNDIKTVLTDLNQYIDPRLWTSVFSAHYKCNIFLYVIDSQNPNGNVVIPNNKQAYLLKDIDTTTTPSVFIVMFETGSEDYPYQCEIFCYLTMDGSKVTGVDYTFTNDPISNMAAKILYDSNEVFIVSKSGYDPYLPVYQ